MPADWYHWGMCEFIKVHIQLPPSPIILWIELGGKPKWLPLNFGYHDVMRTGSFLGRAVIVTFSLGTVVAQTSRSFRVSIIREYWKSLGELVWLIAEIVSFVKIIELLYEVVSL